MTQPQGDAVLTAMLMAFHTQGAQDNTVEAIAAQLTATAQRRVEIVHHSAGRAVRVSGVEAIRFGERELDCVLMQTLIPAPTGGVLNVVLTSPQTELAENWLDLFDAISSTLAWQATTASTPETDTTEG